MVGYARPQLGAQKKIAVFICTARARSAATGFQSTYRSEWVWSKQNKSCLVVGIQKLTELVLAGFGVPRPLPMNL